MPVSLGIERSPAHKEFVVGTTVVLAPDGIRGIIIDVILEDNVAQFAYVVVAFEVGSAFPVIYQAIRWNLLRRVVGGFVVHAVREAIVTGVPASLSVVPYRDDAESLRGSPFFVASVHSVHVH